MEGLVMAAQLILGLAILVTLHELGHFLAARAFGIKVEKFYLFFDAWGFKLFSFKKGDTEYGIGWLPLGGYVKIAGMVDESMDTEKLKLEPQPWEFRSKPAWQRLIVMIGGVTVNAILGVIIFMCVLLGYTKGYVSNDAVKDGIYAYELGREAGLMSGDKIISIDGNKVERFEDVLSTRVMLGADLEVERDGQVIDVKIPGDLFHKVGKLGRGYFVGPDNIPFIVDSLVENGPASKAGIKPGDKILAVNDTAIHVFGEIRESLRSKASKKIELSLLRGVDTVHTTAVVSEDGTLGFFSNRSKEAQIVPYTVSSALRYGASDAVEAIASNAKGLGRIFKGQEKASDSVQGPIGIAKIYGGQWDWQRFWGITGLLSMVLAFMNILPIPALDGGHVIFLIIESVTKKKFSDQFMEKAQLAGMVILLGLMVFALGNDVWKHILN